METELSDLGRGGARPSPSVAFRNPWLFWAGATATAVGVALHFPMYLSTADMGYRMAGMRPDATMYLGMALILGGLAASVYGIVPRRRPDDEPLAPTAHVAVGSDTRLNSTSIKLLVVLALAVVIDAMKPISLAFVAPGMAREYGLTSAANPHGGLPVALVPLAGITGTVIGSFLWGWFGDRIGRRASIILAGLLFMATAICGTMPSFQWNLFMCFMMGIGAGGMLPITFTLIAETVPARHRGWLMVVIGGEITATYAIVSWLASALIPHFAWRILWLLGLPTGLLLIVLSRWIPESARFLLARGRIDEANAVLRRFGAKLVAADQDAADRPPVAPEHGTFAQRYRSGLAGRSVLIILLGIGIGFVTYGFQLWIPTNLQKLGLGEVASDTLLRNSALIGYPFTFVAAWLYGFWSSKKTILLVTVVTVLSLIGFVSLGDAVTKHQVLLTVLMAVPLLATGTLVAVLGAYTSEVYPTIFRARGSGLAAGASKAGGVVIIALTVAAVAAPSIRATALVATIPLVLAVGATILFGVETSRRRLDEISAGPLPVSEPVGGSV
jgi:putative MFS transporter